LTRRAEQTYWKIPFEWVCQTAPPDDPLPDGWSWLDGRTLPEPVELVADVLASSPGPEDRLTVDVLGAEEAARRVLGLAPGFSYLRERWEVLSTRDRAAGFVLPVIYDGCSREGLDEATIYHMGVAPEHRRAGIGRLLLRRATLLLVRHGVWRIYCDTASENRPMIHLFETEGWTRLPAHERPLVAPN
jgi:GNAT superfamily N-acetyltransferase